MKRTQMAPARWIELLLRRDRLVVAAMLAVVAASAWLYMLQHASSMHGPMYFSTAAWMWMAMMVAMMLPTAAPMILVFSRLRRQQHAGRHPVPATAVFVAGYLAIWAAFSVLAAVLQLALHHGMLLSSMGEANPLLGAGLLIATGAFQWSGLKEACLAKCRTPFGFLATEWRDGSWGGFVMGVRHGAFCLGCCWALMMLMFVGGVMNLLWMAALTVYMLAEKIAPHGATLGRVTGVLLVAAGIALAVFQ